ncbi:RHS repeat-associated core domain-containing protein [Chryseobacterium sp. ISL-6]|uniref:RHS repeat-associated core domain-containing protein n=1 Tax=Chryseobacterium sp. ISL-6 TaxID=2819143 RepID=UPI001BEB0886|nr:RHS repeat-associated core domain-containing protein [Chryseobacterium sp. ISL-6]MBT2620095.1 type IV secretion protein Rhs [Chryseobacterium sp. ISL-6]
MKLYARRMNVFSSIISCIIILGFSQLLSGQSFHDTKGNIDVNGAGQLQFTLPVALPPGVKSVAPQVNLIYTSGSNNGIAGYSWNLSGLTAISRVGKTVEKDGEATGVQLDYSDYYSFNGQRLILKSGEYGKDGAEYVTEKYSSVKIKSVGQAYYILEPLNSPAYFEVTFEDGSRAWYGTWEGAPAFDYAARTPIEYNIVKWIDAQGNVINYNYEQESNVTVLSSISWGGNELLNKPNFNEIILTYATRDLVEQSYVGGKDFTQKKILTEIKVASNGNQFKKYIVNYIKNGTNYQVVDKITEYNTDNIAANPVNFTYPNPTQPILEFSNNNVDSFDNVKLTGDFNGDSYLDFILNNGIVKLGGLNDTFTDVSTGKFFNTEAKIVHTLLDEEGQVYNGNGIVQYESGKVVGYIFRNNNFVKVFEKVVYVDPDCTYQGGGVGCRVEKASFNEGDINGDGISDVFVTINKEECQFEPIPGCDNLKSTSELTGDDANKPPPCHELNCYTYLVGNYIVDLKNPSNPLSNYTVDSGINESSYYQQQYLDVDGDGKVDIINVSNTAYTVFEFVKTAPNHYLKKIKFTGNLAETKASDSPVLFGDFNGDRNLDFAIPTTDTQEKDNWRFYMGTEKSFSNFLKTNFLKYRKPNDYQNSSYPTFNIYRNFYSASDINKDGKSDIVHINSFNKAGQVNSSGVILSRYFGYNIATYSANGTLTSGSPDFVTSGNYGGTNYVTFDVGEFTLFSPITSQVKINNNYYDVLLFWKQRLHKLKSPSSVSRLAQVQSIAQGGVITSVDYLEAIPNNSTNPNFYQKVRKEYYPYFSLDRVDESYAVSQLRQEGRKQDFRYRGMTGHMQGKGMMGYHQVVRSSWYADGFENTKVWSGVEIDPLFDGVPVKEWSIRTNNENSIFPVDISETNTQLMSFKSTLYESYKLLNGQLATIPISDTDKPKVVTATVVKGTKIKDFLNNTLMNTLIDYGDYYLPSQSVTSVNNGYATTTSNFEYIHNLSGTGADYFVGRPQSKTDIVQAYGDSKSSKEEYTYENNLPKTLKTWNKDNTAYVLETYNYDGFGNIIGKTVSNSTDSQTQTETSLYEPKGRFVEKKTDNLGLESNIEYNDWGQIKKHTDALGNMLINTYDGWGKLLTAATNLKGTITYQYDKDNNSNITITQYDPDGNVSKKYTNRLGQEYKVSTKAFGQGQFVSKDIQYDVLGRKITESETYFEGQSPSQWNTIAYDDSVFPIMKVTATAFNGKQIETIASGLTTTVKESNPADYGRITSKTVDALGNVVTTTDKGGTIQFSYNAAGQQIKAQYAENIVTTKYDVWGRKSEFNDPSNGVYKYEYDGLGQPKKIISPKGTKEYTYNNLGQLINQVELSSDGVSTIKNITFTYDSFGRNILKSGTSNGKSYSSSVEFDTYGRMKSNIENSNGRVYAQSGFFYDDKSRVISYTKSLSSAGIVTAVTIIHKYNAWNGDLYQLMDKKTGLVLWELQSTNAKGQTLTSKLGAATITNSYDSNGFLTNISHSSAIKPNILQISYAFDAIKNELKSRSTGGDFNINESFDYDDNNRLVNWTDPVTGVKPSANRNIYDVKGRITENDQVGVIKFENSSKIYQPTGMTLNAAGTQNYNNDLIQFVTYNENNDPIFIDGLRGDVDFEYGLTSMRQKVSYGGNFVSNKGKFIKLYSEDGSFEVTIDNSTKFERHTLYIGGTPYESNIVYLKNYKETSGSYKFLHKDYLGSILAISDAEGKKLEQRHFDAWGNFTHLQIGTGTIITQKSGIQGAMEKFGLIDRGYTSHEHFMDIGIIHMNGRLYDPLLRRFLNADEHIQDPTNTQNYNKYGYVLNNPLMFNDTSGEFWQFLAIPIVKALVFAVVSYTAITLITGAKFNILNLYSTIVMSLISAGITTVIGDVFSTATASVGNEALKGLVHAGVQGTLSFMQGGNFFSAAASAFLASFVSYGYGKVAGDAAYSGAGTVAFGMLSGGVGSALSGGNFWDGVKIGGIVALFNHTMHKISDNLLIDKQTRKEFRQLVKAKNYQGAFDLVNSKYNLDANIKGKYTMEYVKSDEFSGLTGGEAFETQEVTIATHVFKSSVAVFIRVVHHEFIHVYQRGVMGLAGNLSIYEVREFLAYHDTLFNDKLPKASFSNMEGYWNKAKQFYNYMTANPALIRAYQSQYNDFANSRFFK